MRSVLVAAVEERRRRRGVLGRWWAEDMEDTEGEERSVVE
jgi:hypothetical protein